MIFFSTLLTQVTIKVYHYHDKVPVTDLTKHTLLGELVFTLASLLTSREKKVARNLVGGKGRYVTDSSTAEQRPAVSHTGELLFFPSKCCYP
jgi:hypothetical protein